MTTGVVAVTAAVAAAVVAVTAAVTLRAGHGGGHHEVSAWLWPSVSRPDISCSDFSDL